MTAIITDKQSIAKQIALALNIELKNNNENCFRGNGFTVVWTSGELVSLLQPEDYGKKRFQKNDLPFIPKHFVLGVQKQKTEKKSVLTSTTDKTAAKQLDTIKKIFDECGSIITATEPNEKGELSFRNIYDYLQCDKPFKRLRTNSLTLKAINEGLKNLNEGSLYDNLYASADCRAKADYLFNVNISRAFSLATGMINQALGRVEIPILAMICKRFAEYRTFAAERYFELGVTLEKDDRHRFFRLSGIIGKKKKAEKLYERLKTYKEAQITQVKTRTAIQPAPLLYNLTELQKEANRCYGFSGAKTMEIARKLYEEKLISYPLTDLRYIPEIAFTAVYKILRQTADYCELTDKLEAIDSSNLNRCSVGNIQSYEHYALIPTGIYPPYLSKEDKLIYKLIAVRTFEAFASDCLYEITDIKAACDDMVLESSVSEIICSGWRMVQNREENRIENELKPNEVFPAFEKGENVRISGWNLLTKKTLPESLYTEANLLSAMENACLGTAETRAEIIETLLSCGYMERKKQHFIPTEKGQVVYNCIKNMRITDIELATSWENMLADIRRGKQSADTFMRAFEIFITQATKEVLSYQKPVL